MRLGATYILNKASIYYYYLNDDITMDAAGMKIKEK